MVDMKPALSWIYGLYCFLWLIQYCSCETVLQYLDDVVVAENYAYYRLNKQGRIQLRLESYTGDADLYVSDSTLHPSFDNYVQQSVTCGIDEVTIPATYNRPIGISVYGHPAHDESKYRITIIHLSDHDDESYAQLVNIYHNYETTANGEGHYDGERSDPSPGIPSHSDMDDDDEGSLIWQVFVFIVKMIFEILV